MPTRGDAVPLCPQMLACEGSRLMAGGREGSWHSRERPQAMGAQLSPPVCSHLGSHCAPAISSVSICLSPVSPSIFQYVVLSANRGPLRWSCSSEDRRRPRRPGTHLLRPQPRPQGHRLGAGPHPARKSNVRASAAPHFTVCISLSHAYLITPLPCSQKRSRLQSCVSSVALWAASQPRTLWFKGASPRARSPGRALGAGASAGAGPILQESPEPTHSPEFKPCSACAWHMLCHGPSG